ncbi:SPX domain-containing protein [Salix suchowensis]|nr:SPX domain-containing protein [Salix suchowensis]
MKFWKSLSNLIEETVPEWRDEFLSYKDLKKQLKLIYPKDGDKPLNKRPRLDDDQMEGGDGDGGEVEKEVIDFVRVLEDEMEKFNAFIVEKEEDSVIKWKELQDKVEKVKDSNEELMREGREIVDFHGEMVLLENYSALNYTDTEKYDKRSGALVRMPFIQKVMQQPFYTTHVLTKLIKECEAMLDRVFSRNEPSVSPHSTEVESRDDKTANANAGRSLGVPNELPEIEYMESMYVKPTLSALRVLKEIRSGSSTVNMYSLPPLQSNTQDGDRKKVTVLEQTAQ